ncbi:sulfur oxidation c-type cytochrome SoxX [Sulfitobacter sp. LCG007]
MRLSILVAATLLAGTSGLADVIAPGEVVFEDGAVSGSLSGQPGDVENGRALMDKGSGNCIACHSVTALSDLQFHGEIGPVLDGAGDRWSEAELRGIVANAKMMFPGTMMPSFYRVSDYIRPGAEFTGKAIDPAEITPLLTAQEVEDVVAYLKTLKE